MSSFQLKFDALSGISCGKKAAGCCLKVIICFYPAPMSSGRHFGLAKFRCFSIKESTHEFLQKRDLLIEIYLKEYEHIFVQFLCAFLLTEGQLGFLKRF